ncbi:hypothetical protein K8R03_01635 [Candidatus Kaiserbacteria bacterium]|nr:hypothetical protein [Candidatus Kaiserbacteria bacterium]
MNPTDKALYGSAVAIAAAVVVFGGGWFLFKTFMPAAAPAATGAQNGQLSVSARLSDAYKQFSGLSATSSALSRLAPLGTFRDIAADTRNTQIQRARALNGISYGYMNSRFSSDDMLKVVFSKEPFSSYYKAPATDSDDALAVADAVTKLNALSNALVPNHYAISRMEVAEISAYTRAAAQLSADKRKSQASGYAEKIRELIGAYDSLPPLKAVGSAYSTGMQMQILIAHASALAFVGEALDDASYSAKGEALFEEIIQIGETSISSGTATSGVLNSTQMARIFYAAQYWSDYKDSNPQKIMTMLQPLITAGSNTNVYRKYLPDNKDSKIRPFSTLREIAQQMPALKAYLEGRGWIF